MLPNEDDKITVYVTIGNSDDKLSQAAWSDFIADVDYQLDFYAYKRHGQWFSAPDAPWQNACWCVVLWLRNVEQVKAKLKTLAVTYGQDSIAWAPATVEFLAP